MTPFPRPLRAIYSATVTPPNVLDSVLVDEIVAVIATDEDEFLAVDGRGKIVAGPHYLFTILDWDIRALALDGS